VAVAVAGVEFRVLEPVELVEVVATMGNGSGGSGS
jgi:hypothetical protein